jgi:hypothetical protein
MTAINPFSGFGLGLRRPHYQDFIEQTVPVDFVEVISENFMVDGGNPLQVLEKIRNRFPVVLHGVSMSIGSAQGLDPDYLTRLNTLAERIEPLWISDHISWSRTHAHNSHDLLPLPYTRDTLEVVCNNIDYAQDQLGRALLFENPSSYLTFPDDEMHEWEFVAQIAQRCGSYLLLDINNVFVSAHNHGFSAADYLAGLPLDRVRQIHLAGHSDGEIKIDTHDQPVCDGVWQLYTQARGMLGEVATMIERDDKLPALSDLLEELAIARQLAKATDSRAAA